ncbi:MAG: glycosyltransferase [Candidatus Aenigmarchaeota archaeon]|nr:glycosyltransferase [Candidatus Aenigmarchaeota archaeon]
MAKDLSLVLPCYNEEAVFEESVGRILRLLKATRYDFEILLVDDQSRDRTRELMRKAAAKDRRITCLYHDRNRGRGRTVADGIRKATGRIVGYLDIDLEIREEAILSHALAIDEGYDIAYADRITGLKPGNLLRHLLHALYILQVRVFLGFAHGDTNAGCKFFNRKRILPVLERVRDDHWFWDTEILLRGYAAGMRIKKIPVVYLRNDRKKSTVRMGADAAYFLRKIMAYRRER